MFNRKLYKKEAWVQTKGLRKKMLLPLLLTVIFCLVIYLAYYIPFANSFGKGDFSLLNSVRTFISSIIMSFVMTVLLYAWSLFVYNNRKSEDASFKAFKNCFSKNMILGAALDWLWTMIWSLPYQVVFIFVWPILMNYNINADASYQFGKAYFGLFVIYASLFYMIFAYRKILGYSMISYIIAENPKISARKAMNYSKKMCKGCRENIAVLFLSFLPWFLFGVLTLGFGFIAVIPYLKNAFINAYEDIKKNAFETKVLTEEDFNVLQ